jgi:aminoglycoside phosphotransferase (APT) family kinase protein
VALLKTLDAEHMTERLGEWLAHAVPGAREISIEDVEVPTASGMSATTILFRATYDEGGQHRELDLVARVAPDHEARLFEDMDLARDFRVVQALSAGTEIPIPTPRWLETDPEWLGATFVVSDRVYGQVPADDPPFTASGWVMELAPERRARLVRHGLEVLAAVHAADWQALELGFLDRPDRGPAGVAQEIERFHVFYRWVAGDDEVPTIEAAFEWMRANQPPAHDPLVLCWGDARPGNMMYGDDESVQGVFDWEMATIGPAEMDLGWWLAIQRHHTEAIGVPLPEGIPGRDETIAMYEEISGRTVREMEYYEALAALRMSVLFMRVGKLLIAGGALPPDHPMPFVNPAIQMLAAMLELPVPQDPNVAVADSSGGFLGSRGTAE